MRSGMVRTFVNVRRVEIKSGVSNGNMCSRGRNDDETYHWQSLVTLVINVTKPAPIEKRSSEPRRNVNSLGRTPLPISIFKHVHTCVCTRTKFERKILLPQVFGYLGTIRRDLRSYVTNDLPANESPR